LDLLSQLPMFNPISSAPKISKNNIMYSSTNSLLLETFQYLLIDTIYPFLTPESNPAIATESPSEAF